MATMKLKKRKDPTDNFIVVNSVDNVKAGETILIDDELIKIVSLDRDEKGKLHIIAGRGGTVSGTHLVNTPVTLIKDDERS